MQIEHSDAGHDGSDNSDGSSLWNLRRRNRTTLTDYDYRPFMNYSSEIEVLKLSRATKAIEN